ncbi:phospholipase D family protein [Calothrix sp. FACHB-1219]|uniref:restriction endonuclease PLD domain-containing protein n=1 Tax=Calothrix sp. FACHB-1219 TaxID=2692778 RepID=UPI00168A3E1B|nr:phospholipase D family protein [Calothrix sp. FACHB-1219]
MKYLDTGTKDASQTLTQWFIDVLTDEVSALRMQTGYFRFGATRALLPLLARLGNEDITTHVVIGSNDSDTLHSDVSRLFSKLEMPRESAKLAVVQFTNALFHSKVYHVTRADGSQAAFVGSANFTEAAILGGNVEAAVSLDSRLGDSVEVLTKISQAVDHWLIGEGSKSAHQVSSLEDVDKLLESGILAKQRAIREAQSQARANQASAQSGTRRSKLIVLPPWPDNEPDEVESEDATLDLDEPGQDAPSAIVVPAELVPVVPPVFGVDDANDEFGLDIEKRHGFPAHILFEPGAVDATSGWTALSGARLKAPYVGLIMKLTRDSARHFEGGTGTANISIPVAVAETFRFGVYPRSGRPRAEFSLRLRYHASTLRVEQSCQTNVMAYGVLPEDTGHGDLRMVLPAAVRKVAEEVVQNGLPLPKNGDLFLMEWPNEEFDHFRITFLEPGCAEHAEAALAYEKAEHSHQLMGGSCGLERDISPEW